VVRVPVYRSRGPGSISCAARFSEKQWVWKGVHSASWVRLRSYLKERVAASVKKTEITAVGIRRTDHATPLYPQKLALTSPTSGGRSVGIVRSRTKATELVTDLRGSGYGHVIIRFPDINITACRTCEVRHQYNAVLAVSGEVLCGSTSTMQCSQCLAKCCMALDIRKVCTSFPCIFRTVQNDGVAIEWNHLVRGRWSMNDNSTYALLYWHITI
jgi:hypothetical protein